MRLNYSAAGSVAVEHRRRPAAESGLGPIDLLCVSPIQEDHRALKRILDEAHWTVHTASTLTSAIGLLRRKPIPLVICEQDVPPLTWRELLDGINLMPDPPFLVVSCQGADERLWAEALNLGAYDVLAKPFDRAEALRILGLAWFHWRDRHGTAAMPIRAMRAAG